MKGEETFSVGAPIDQIRAFITEPHPVAPRLPGCETGAVSSGPVKTAFSVNREVTELRPPVYSGSVTRGKNGEPACAECAAASRERVKDHA